MTTEEDEVRNLGEVKWFFLIIAISKNTKDIEDGRS